MCSRRVPPSPGRSPRWRSDWRSTFAAASPPPTAPCARDDEKWLLEGAEGCFSLYGARVGLIGFGDLARAFVPLLQPFGCPVKAYDPWISDHFMAGFGVAAASLEEVLKTSQVIVVFAAVTSENQGFLGKREFEMIAPGSVVSADEPRRRGRFPRVPAPGRERTLSRRDRRLSRTSRRRPTIRRARSRACCCRLIAPAR